MRGAGLFAPPFKDDSAYFRAVMKDAPVLYWAFWDRTGTAVDSSGSGFHGTVGTGIVRGVPDPNGQMPMHRFIGTSHVAVSDTTGSPLDFTNAGSLECWCVPDFAGSGDGGGLIAKVSCYFLRVRTAGTIQGYFYPTGNISTSPTLTANRLYHVVVTYNKVNQKLYINGALVDTQSDTVAITANDNALCAGSDAAGSPTYYKGLIGHAAVYNTALTAEQVRAHYQALR